MLWLAAPSALGAAAPRARRAATAAADAAGARATGLAHASLSRRAASAARAPLAARAGAFTAGAACAGDGAAGGNGGNGSSEQHSPPSRDAGPEAGGPLGDDFWRDGGGFPHYLQSRVSPSREARSLRSLRFISPRAAPALTRAPSSPASPRHLRRKAPNRSPATAPTPWASSRPPTGRTCLDLPPHCLVARVTNSPTFTLSAPQQGHGARL